MTCIMLALFILICMHHLLAFPFWWYLSDFYIAISSISALSRYVLGSMTRPRESIANAFIAFNEYQ